MPGGARAGAGRPARPQKLDDEAIESIVQSVREAQLVEVAAARVGVRRETIYDWLRRGAAARVKQGRLTKTDRLCLDLSNRIQVAAAEAEREVIGGIRSAHLGPAETTVVTTTTGHVWSEEKQELVEVDSTTTRVETKPGDWRAGLALAERRWRKWNQRLITESGDDDATEGEGEVATSAKAAVMGQLEEMTARLEGLAQGGLAVDDDDEAEPAASSGPAGGSLPEIPEPRRGPRIMDPGEEEGDE